jgi:hypothetical protein
MDQLNLIQAQSPGETGAQNVPHLIRLSDGLKKQCIPSG